MNEALEKELTIITPEQVQLQFQTAGLGSRALAHLLDSLFLGVINAVWLLGLAGLSRLFDGKWLPGTTDYALAVSIMLLLLLNIGYWVGTEAFMGGQTPGKRITGLRVLQNNGQSATFLSILIRNLFRLIDMLPVAYFLGAAVMLVNSKDKRLGDLVAGTIVVIEVRQERIKRRKNIDKAIAKWQSRLPLFVLDEPAKSAVTSDDWQLLSAWIDRLPGMPIPMLEQWAIPIARHFTVKLQHDHTAHSGDAAYLIALYLQLRDDWEV